MEPAKLRHRLILKTNTPTATSDGGMPYENFTTEATIWGRVANISGREAYYAKQVQPDATHRITLRDHVSVTPDKQLVHGSRVFNVLDVQSDGEPDGYQTVIVMEKK